MRISFRCYCAARSFFFPFALLSICVFLCGSTTNAATNKKPILISQATSTRAVAFESVTMRAEPFPLMATVPFSADTRTRICIFAMDLELLPGEGANAFTSDVQDTTGKLYPLRVEYVGQVPSFPGITMIVVRLNDELGDVGDVLLRLNLHGMSSNRVRVAIGHAGGGPVDDVGAVATPAPQRHPCGIPRWCSCYLDRDSEDTVRSANRRVGARPLLSHRVKAMGFTLILTNSSACRPRTS